MCGVLSPLPLEAAFDGLAFVEDPGERNDDDEEDDGYEQTRLLISYVGFVVALFRWKQ